MKNFTFAIVLLVMGSCSNGNDPVADAKKYCRCIEKAQDDILEKMPECFEIHEEILEKYKENEEDLSLVKDKMKACSMQ